MSLTNVAKRPVVTAIGRETVRIAVARMAETNVGFLVVVDEHTNQPIGVLTDRDIAVRCIGKQRDPDRLRISEVMSHPVHLIYEHVPLEQALARMADVGTRRLVVVGENGRPVGVVSLDDALELVAREVESIGRILAAQGSRFGHDLVLAGRPEAGRLEPTAGVP